MQRGTFRKCKDGTWGAWVAGEKPRPGDTVELHKKDGSTAEVVIYEVLDEGAFGWECTLEGDTTGPYVRHHEPDFDNDLANFVDNYYGGGDPSDFGDR